MMVNNNLVGGAMTILKHMNSSMGRMTSHILWKLKFIFETTKQYYWCEKRVGNRFLLLF